MPTTFWQDRFKKVVRDTLVNDSEVNSLVGVSVLYGELGELRPRTYPVVTYTFVSLGSSNGAYDHTGIIRVWVWAKDQDTASDLWKRVGEVFFHRRVSGVDIDGVIEPMLNTLQRFEPDTSLTNYAGEFKFRAFDHQRVP